MRKIIVIISLLIILSIVIGCLILSGFFSNVHGPLMLYVDPQTSVGVVGEDFAVDIHLSNVADLYSWNLRLRWNTTLLDVVNVTEGSFLKSGGETLFGSQINVTTSSVFVYCTLLGNVSGVNGSGTLVTVQFNVKESGQCDLDLCDVMLANSLEEQIDTIIYDGHFRT